MPFDVHVFYNNNKIAIKNLRQKYIHQVINNQHQPPKRKNLKQKRKQKTRIIAVIKKQTKTHHQVRQKLMTSILFLMNSRSWTTLVVILLITNSVRTVSKHLVRNVSFVVLCSAWHITWLKYTVVVMRWESRLDKITPNMRWVALALVLNPNPWGLQ